MRSRRQLPPVPRPPERPPRRIAVCLVSVELFIVFNPADPVGTLRNLTNIGSKEIIGTMLDKINMTVDGGQLI